MEFCFSFDISFLNLINSLSGACFSEVLGYGISLILLNVGMYIAVPLGIGIVLVKSKKEK
jgi:phage-related minor tail protein